MNNKCVYKNIIVQNNRNIKLLFGIIILLSLLLFFSYKDYMFSFFQILLSTFYNVQGKFDYSIFWSAIDCFFSFLGFIGIILTIIYTENSRRKQNKYAFVRDNLIGEQEKFKVDMRKMFDDIDPIQILAPVLNTTTANYNDTYNFLLSYRTKIKSLSYKINWYYSFNMQTNLMPKYNLFLNKVGDFVSFVDPIIESCSNTITNYNQISIYENLIKLEKYSALSQEQQRELNDYLNKYPNGSNDLLNVLRHNNSNELSKLIDYRNNKWEQEFAYSCKEMIEERNNWVQTELSKIK